MLEGTHFEEFESEPCPVGACNKYEKYLEVSIRDQQMYSERFQDQDVLLTLTSYIFSKRCCLEIKLSWSYA